MPRYIESDAPTMPGLCEMQIHRSDIAEPVIVQRHLHVHIRLDVGPLGKRRLDKLGGTIGQFTDLGHGSSRVGCPDAIQLVGVAEVRKHLHEIVTDGGRLGGFTASLDRQRQGNDRSQQ